MIDDEFEYLRAPAHRTRERYELEKEFQPLFDFLAEEKKDLSKVAVYGSSISLSKQTSTTIDDYHVSLSGGKKPTGSYYVTINDKKEEYLVDFMDNELHYRTSPPREYDMDIFNLCLKPDTFSKSTISDYMAKHPETSIKSISYDVTSLNLFPEIKSKYNFGKEAITTLRIKMNGDDTYSIKIYIGDAIHGMHVSNSIIIKSEDKK